MNKDLIAVCGMNCGICDKYLAYSHDLPKKKGKIIHCLGCRTSNKKCGFVKQKCITGKIDKIEFCYECEAFPCDNLQRIVKGYVKRYNYNVIENLIFIKENGLDKFILEEKNKYKCSKCGDTICVHNHKCYSCDKVELIG